MALFHLKNLLRIGLPLVALVLLGALVISLMLVSQTVDATTGSPQVRLVLDTRSPNLFSTLHDIKEGFEDGYYRPDASQPQGAQLPAVLARSTSFELTADAQTPLLRYQEPSGWKRLALLYVGAADNNLSLAGVIFFLVGSWLLCRLLLDVTPETPFTFTNARRLRSLGLLVLGLGLAQELAYVALRALIPPFRAPGVAEPLSHYVRLNTETSLPGWEVGLMLLVIAAVYQRGVVLSQEAEWTV